MMYSGDYQASLNQLIRDPEAEIGTGATENEIVQAEEALGGRFPVEYRAFLAQVGWGGRDYWEIAGLGQGVPFHLDVVRLTFAERRDCGLPLHLVPVYNDGGLSLYCVSLASPQHPLTIWDLEPTTRQGISHHDSFAGWFTKLLYAQ